MHNIIRQWRARAAVGLVAFIWALLAVSGAEAATLYISEFQNAVGIVGSTVAQVYPQIAVTDQTVALSGSSAISAAFNSKTHAVLLTCDEGCSINFGGTVATTSNYLLQQGVQYQFVVAAGAKVAVIANAAGNSSGGGGGGGGAVTIASGAVASGGYSSGALAAGAGSDGWDVAQGATADAAAAAGGIGTVSAKLREISSQLATPAAATATENHIGEVGENEISTQIAQTVTASSAYATGNAVGGLMTVTSATRVSGTAGASGTGGLLQAVVMNTKSAQTTSTDVFIFNANPTSTTCTDKTAFALNSADFDKVVGVAHINDFTAGNVASIGQAQNLAMVYVLASATSIYACAVTRGTPTWTATSDVSFGFKMLRD